jgi:hypothetical protein
MKKKQYIYNSINYDSKEEIDFAKWIEEADKAGFIEGSIYHPDPFLLIPSAYIPLNEKKEICLHRAHTYRADWCIRFTPKFYKLFPDVFMLIHNKNVYVDIKGANPRMISESDHTFRVNQKLVYDKFKIWVHKIILCDYRVGKNMRPGFFSKTFCPQSAYFMSNRKVLTARKVYSNCKLLREIV